MSKLKLYASAILGTFLIASGLFGCEKNVDCDINYDHAHAYSNANGITRYIKSERENVGDFSWTNQTRSLDKDDEKLLKFLNKNDLYAFIDNKEYLDLIKSQTQPHIEYEYKYQATVIKHYLDGKDGIITYSSIGMKTHIDYDGDTVIETYPNIPVYGTEERTDFTSDPNHENLTGNASDVYYQYTAYKVISDYNGKLSIEKSLPMTDIYELEYTYNYFKEKDLFTKIYGPIYQIKTLKK